MKAAVVVGGAGGIRKEIVTTLIKEGVKVDVGDMDEA